MTMCVVVYIDTDILEEVVVYIFSVQLEYGGIKYILMVLTICQTTPSQIQEYISW